MVTLVSAAMACGALAKPFLSNWLVAGDRRRFVEDPTPSRKALARFSYRVAVIVFCPPLPGGGGKGTITATGQALAGGQPGGRMPGRAAWLPFAARSSRPGEARGGTH